MPNCKCGKPKPRRYAMCRDTWDAMPLETKRELLKASIANDKQGKGTLRRLV